MRKTLYRLFPLALIMVSFAGCSQSIEGQRMNASTYRDGPHLLLEKKMARVMYFRPDNNRWTLDDQLLRQVEGAELPVDNPVFEPFSVKLRASPEPPPAQYPACPRLLVVSDIEGNLNALYELLLAQGVIDEGGRWTYGEGHLLMLGDLFDRGPDVTPLLWLLYRLEAEALTAGGRVHILLGNHELMIFEGDLRYIHPKYQRQSLDTGISYSRLFSGTSVLGQWLRSKPAVIRIGDMLFSHAGISPAVLGLRYDLEAINELVRRHSQGKPVSPKARRLFGAEGIFWYRDWVDDPPGERVLQEVLDFYGVKHMIIGHTIVPEIRARYDYRLILTDLHRPEGRPAEALSVEQGSFYQVDNRGNRFRIPLIE